MSKKYKVWIFWALMLIGALLVVSQSSYSDGDDAFFYQYTNSMGFGEYLSWRYQTWVGRMSGEAFVYLAFRLGLGFWRVVNAVMLVLLPMGFEVFECFSSLCFLCSYDLFVFENQFFFWVQN